MAETEEKADDVATAGVQEENEKEKSEERNVEAPKKLIEDDNKDTEEESKSQGEPEAEQAELKEQADVATAGAQSTPNKETESKTEGRGRDCSRK